MKRLLTLCIFVVLVLAVVACGLRFKDDRIICELKACEECVNAVNLQDGDAKILLGDKIMDVKIESIINGEHGGERLIIGDKELEKTNSSEINFDKLYVFDNEMILVTLTGEVALRSDFQSNYFYDKNLNPVEINLVLDKDYPNNMIQVYSTDLDVKNNKLIIKGSRLKEGLVLVSEDGSDIKLCESSGNLSNYAKEHIGEVLDAKYEATYLGNNKFSDFKKTEDVRVINSEVCDYD